MLERGTVSNLEYTRPIYPYFAMKMTARVVLIKPNTKTLIRLSLACPVETINVFPIASATE
jgi:hypothetical protein